VNVSRFFGATNREALRQVRMALGPDALIVSNRRVNGGVEILATDQTAVPGETPQAAAQPRPAAAQGGQDVMQAIGAMRGVLEARIDELMWGSQLRQAPQAVALFQRLLSAGFSTALLRAMLQRLPGRLSPRAALEWSRNELAAHLPVAGDEPVPGIQGAPAPGAVIALVGPTGVGKTTTVAKLAARVLRQWGGTGTDAGGEAPGLTLVTTDTYRIGAHEQLRIYGRMMGVPVRVAQDAQELAHLLNGLDPRQSVLIDNVGIGQRDRHVAEQAAMLAALPRRVQRLLVLNASSDGDTLDEVARAYSNDGGTPLGGCIVTKVDEATRLGPVLDTAIRYQLPIHYVCTGQRVPEDISRPLAAELVDGALAQPAASRTLFSPSQADIAALISVAAPASAEEVPERPGGRRLLPGLLALGGAGAGALPDEALERALAYLEEDIACAQAHALWRRCAVPSPDLPAAPDAVAAARGEAALAGGGCLLAMHDGVALQDSHGAGRLHACVLMGEAGSALTTPLQWWSRAGVWQSSDGGAALSGPPDSAALRMPLRQLRDSLRPAGVVHLLDGAAKGLWRPLSQDGAAWLAQCAGATAVMAEGCAATAAAVAKSLAYRPAAEGVRRLGLATVQGLPAGDAALWMSSCQVGMAGRRGDVPVRLLALRVMDRRSGATHRTLLGLSNAPASLADADMLAAWLLLRAEARQAFRYAARYWPLLEESCQAREDADMARTAMQAGLATWHAMHAAQAEPLRRALNCLAGGGRLTAPNVAASMLKLFALKEMLA